MSDSRHPSTPDGTGHPRHDLVSATEFRDGMAHLAAAVNIVTTGTPDDPVGFTATSVCSVSDAPPTLLVCANRERSLAQAFLDNGHLCVNTLGAQHRDLALLFGGGTPMAERFAQARWELSADNVPYLPDAAATFHCRISQSQIIGTHAVLYCEVRQVTRTPGTDALTYFRRAFHELPDR